MNILKQTAMIAALALLPATAAFAADATLGPLRIHHPWIKLPPPGAAVASAYVTIENTGSQDDKLLSVSIAGVDKAQLHEMKMQGDAMMMAELKDGLVLPAGQTAALKPGASHVMLSGLRAPFKDGAVVKGSMIFEKAGTVEVEFDVSKP